MSKPKARRRQRHKLSAHVGLPPGSAIYRGEERDTPVVCSVINYDEQNLEEKDAVPRSELAPLRDSEQITWINADGLHKTEVVTAIGADFGLHPLVVEDILNPGTRPKVEEHDGYLFLTIKMVSIPAESFGIVAEQVSLVVGNQWLITFQERPGDAFDGVRDRIRSARGRVRRQRADYLAYALIDAVVDGYLVCLDRTAAVVDDIEDRVFEAQSSETAKAIHALRQELIQFRKATAPVRDSVAALLRDQTGIVQPQTLPYLRDLHDHLLQVSDAIDSQRDRLGAAIELNLSLTNTRLADISRVLTLVATIFLPLTFLVGVYGMNFQYIPELSFKYGYFVVWGVMLTASGVLVSYFRRKGWL